MLVIPKHCVKWTHQGLALGTCLLECRIVQCRCVDRKLRFIEYNDIKAMEDVEKEAELWGDGKETGKVFLFLFGKSTAFWEVSELEGVMPKMPLRRLPTVQYGQVRDASEWLPPPPCLLLFVAAQCVHSVQKEK